MSKRLKTVDRAAATLAGLLLVTVLPAGANLPDPTRPVSAAQLTDAGGGTAASATLTLQSVLIAGQRRLAIINGQRLQVGDTIAGSEVTQIKPGEVQLRRDDQLQTLTVYNRPAGFVRGQPRD